MRILANYGHKTNGDSFNVTFETTGDVPMEKSEETIDMLFKRAREAVQRQIDIGEGIEALPSDEVTIPKPKTNNGNGSLKVKDPGSPLTGKQKSLIYRLAKEHNRFIENVDDLSKGEASELIGELMAV